MKRVLRMATAAVTCSAWALLLPTFHWTRPFRPVVHRAATRWTNMSPWVAADTTSGANALHSVRFPPMPWLIPTSDTETESASTSDSLLSLHLIVLVHGWMGNPSELGYLQEALERQAAAITATAATALTPLLTDLGSAARATLDTPLYTQTLARQRHKILVHAAVCNHGRTNDGVAAGGQRLASEINDWIRHIQHSLGPRHRTAKVSLSLVGNSLGGLYARHALPDIEWNNTNRHSFSTLEPAVFCTTATPHLGVASPHTYLPLPSWVPGSLTWVARTLWNDVTLRDLFRVAPSTVVADLVEPRYLQPLARFRTRLALANAFGTDFQVPCSTAAFLSPTDTTRHGPGHFSPTDQTCQTELQWLALVVETERTLDGTEMDEMEASNVCAGTLHDDTAPVSVSSEDLARRLDALGWTKVFCDVRSNLPSVSLPWGSDDHIPATPPHQLTWTSAELWHRFAARSSRQWTLPLGHTLLVANAKNDLYQRLNAAGQPIMDELAHVLIRHEESVIPCHDETGQTPTPR